MKILTFIFAINATLLILHEIESAFEKEWEILRLPCKISGFILIHIPIILLFLYGMIEIEELTFLGLVLGVITGLGGIIPLLVHKILVNRREHFNLLISNVLIYGNAITGALLLLLSARQIS